MLLQLLLAIGVYSIVLTCCILARIEYTHERHIRLDLKLTRSISQTTKTQHSSVTMLTTF